MKKLLLFLLMMVATIATRAYDFEAATEDGVTLCYNITSTTILEISVVGVNDYPNVKKITIPEKVTNDNHTFTVTSIGNYAFKDCVQLTSITIPNSVTTIGNSAFWGCYRLTSINIPNSVTSIGDNAFWCSGLTSIFIPKSVTNIGEGAFGLCSSLASVTIPNSVTNIQQEAFKNCSNLTSITIPNSVTNIGGYAFNGCHSLTSISILGSLISIGTCAFSSCIKLTDMYCYAEKVPTMASNVFKGSYLDHATLHVPESSINSYKDANQWKDFSTIKAIGSEEGPETKVCALPTLSVENGKLRFDCETPNASISYYVKGLSSSQTVKAGESVSPIITIAFYAMAEGYVNSEEQIAEIMILDTSLSDETPVNAPQMSDADAKVKKFIEAGRIVILSSGKRYGIDGKNI